MDSELPTPLVSAKWLTAELSAIDLKVVDASWRFPGQGDAKLDYKKRHIPGAVFFDIDEIADRSTQLPHMLPSSKDFEIAAGALGVSNTDRIVVYDDQGLFSAARVWWTFRVMGHSKVAVLNGGLPKWIAAGGAVSNNAEDSRPRNYKAELNPTLVSNEYEVRQTLTKFGVSGAVLDARPPGRFAGADPEPRPGLRSGHMPGALSLPAGDIVDETGKMIAPAALRALFEGAGVDLTSPVITTCGSGVTAAILSLALETLGHRAHSLYDGSWAEWGEERNDILSFPVWAGADA